MYYIQGGIYDDDFINVLVPEEYGPFEDYGAALVEWRRRTFTQLLDNCFHKLSIIKINS